MSTDAFFPNKCSPGPWASLSSRARVVQELAFLFLFYFFGCVITQLKLQQQSKTQYRNAICSLSQAKHSVAGSSGPTLPTWTLRFHSTEHRASLHDNTTHSSLSFIDKIIKCVNLLFEVGAHKLTGSHVSPPVANRNKRIKEVCQAGDKQLKREKIYFGCGF